MNAPISLNIILRVIAPADVPKVRELLREQGRLSRQEPGCLRFEVYHSESDPAIFILNERWESQSALDVHRTGKAFLEIYKPQVLPIVERTPHVSKLIE